VELCSQPRNGRRFRECGGRQLRRFPLFEHHGPGTDPAELEGGARVRLLRQPVLLQLGGAAAVLPHDAVVSVLAVLH